MWRWWPVAVLVFPAVAGIGVSPSGDTSDVEDDLAKAACVTWLEASPCEDWSFQGEGVADDVLLVMGISTIPGSEDILALQTERDGPPNTQYLLRLTADGQVAWIEPRGVQSQTDASLMAPDGSAWFTSERFYANGSFRTKTTMRDMDSGGVLWTIVQPSSRYVFAMAVDEANGELVQAQHVGGSLSGAAHVAIVRYAIADGSVASTWAPPIGVLEARQLWTDGSDTILAGWDTTRGNEGAVLHRFDANGTESWNRTVPLHSPARVSPLWDAASGLVLVAYHDPGSPVHRVVAINGTTGAIAWDAATGVADSVIPSFVVDGAAFLAGAGLDGDARISRLETADGSLAWSHTIGTSATAGMYLSLSAGGGHVVAEGISLGPATTHRFVSVLEAASGEMDDHRVQRGWTGILALSHGYRASVAAEVPPGPMAVHAVSYDKAVLAAEYECLAKTNGKPKAKCTVAVLGDGASAELI